MSRQHDHTGHRHGPAERLPAERLPAERSAVRPLTRPDWSLIGTSVGMRLLLALPVLAALWLLVAWAMAPAGTGVGR